MAEPGAFLAQRLAIVRVRHGVDEFVALVAILAREGSASMWMRHCVDESVVFGALLARGRPGVLPGNDMYGENRAAPRPIFAF